MMSKIGYIVVVFCFSQIGFSQSSDCRGYLKAYNDKMKSTPNPKGNQVVFINYVNEIAYWDSTSYPRYSTEIKVYLSRWQYHLITPDYEIYRDSLHSIVIIHDQQEVIISNGEVQSDAQIGFLKNQMNQAQDSLMINCTMSPCQLDKFYNQNCEMLKLTPKDRDGLGSYLVSIKYYFDKGTEEMLGSKMEYTNKSEIKEQVYRNKLVDNNYLKYSMSKPVYGKVFNSNNVLSNRLKGYQIIDDRG